MLRNRLFLGLTLAVFALGASAASPSEEASSVAGALVETVLRETYALPPVSLSLRTEPYAPPATPERYWVTVTTKADCHSDAEEVGEVFVQFSGGRLYSVQWLTERVPASEAHDATRARVLQWAKSTFHLGKLISETDKPSTIPTRHLAFESPDGPVTLVLDRRYGFLYRAHRD